MTAPAPGPPGAPILRRTPADAPFFDAAARGELLIRGCPACAYALPMDAYACPHPEHPPGADGLGWLPASGRGTLVSWSSVHRAPHPAFAGQVPYTIALVELDEGPWLEARLVGADPAGLRAGLRLRAAFVHPADPADGESFPVFAPDHPTPDHPTPLATGDPAP
ncbi:Zn-ribbon domain-containing OB-fold protein [Yinghuangia soli]|uniref:OB-fold domain-containing protein n=1 Tax=Yinghuangia soli TaxID=2908204 RepID=A0AA41PUH1_9ACTN|nr:OB-fold domain-containing protein [Yinghuangia soli]MCF2525926.1 OB-fold domain-containing protein [Yinghuangia soli]